MNELKITEIKGLQDVNVYQVCDDDAVAAYSPEEAIEFYKELTGLDGEDVYDIDEIELVDLDELVYEDEERIEQVTVRELVERYWEGKPFLVVTTYY